MLYARRKPVTTKGLHRKNMYATICCTKGCTILLLEINLHEELYVLYVNFTFMCSCIKIEYIKLKTS